MTNDITRETHAGAKRCVCQVTEVKQSNPWAYRDCEKHLGPTDSALAQYLPLQHCGISLLGDPKTREGGNQRGSPKKASGKEIRPSHGGNSGSGPAANHRPPCLFPSPRATSACVCELTTWVTPDIPPYPTPDPLLILALETSHGVTKTLSFSKEEVAIQGQILIFGGHKSL